MLIDTHAHLTDRRFAGELDEVLARAARAGIGVIIDVGDTLESSRQCVAHAERYRNVYATAGIHPNNAASVTPGDRNILDELAAAPGIIAIGETGLDYYRDRTLPDIQKELFRFHLNLAVSKALPAIIHCREAYDDLDTMLEEMEGSGLKAVVHCFSGPRRAAERIIQRGYYLSVGGPLTYPKNDELREIVATMPRDRLLLETDCPYLPPQPFRGKRNEPAYVIHVAEEVARLWEMPVANATETTTSSAKELFGVSNPD